VDKAFSYLKIQIKRRGTIQLIGLGIIFLSVGTCVGVPDNPPGLILTFSGMVFVCFAFVHHWREAGQFGTLLAVSVITFPVLVLIHNIFDGLNEHLGNIPVLTQFFNGLSVLSFLGAIFVAPVGVVIGIFAGLFYLIRSKLP